MLGGAARRRKGIAFEQEICRDLQKNGFPEAKRHFEFRSDDAKGVDLDGTFPFAIQAKCKQTQPNIIEAMPEIDDPMIVPVVIFKVTNKGTYAAFKYEDALQLMRLLKEKM